MEHAKDHIFERVSVALDHDCSRRLYGMAVDEFGCHLKGELSVQESAGRVLRSGREVATE